MIDAALLGTGGMMPLPDRFLTSFLLRYNGRMILTDCGEGTQITLKMLGWGFKNIDTILLTHYHADHISGLPGLLLAVGNSGRTEKLTVAGPKGLKEVYLGLRTIFPELPFDVELAEFEDVKNVSLSSGDILINALKLEHRITCYGYNFELKRRGRFDVAKAKENNVPMAVWGTLQKQDSAEFDGKIYSSDMVLGEERKGIKITYLTDTRPIHDIVDFAKDSDLFICEGMYGENEKKEKAAEKKHMIFSEAAELAAAANVSELWLTHFSPALKDPDEFIDNAKSVFQNTFVGKTRMTKKIVFEDL